MRYCDVYGTYVMPLLRDWSILVPMILMYAGVQFVAAVVYPQAVGAAFYKLVPAERSSVIVRTVSVFNGLLMVGSATCFVLDLRANGYVLGEDVYREIPYYRFFRVSIVAYFVWDIIVCFAYKWGTLWKVHAFASFLGSYLLSFPYSDQYGSYFTGMFELSNVPLHVSSILHTLHVPLADTLVPVCDAVFVMMFVVIRVAGGSVVTSTWLRLMYARLAETLGGGKVMVHDVVGVVISMLLLSIIQGLQYLWLWEIVRQSVQRLTARSGVVDVDVANDEKKLK